MSKHFSTINKIPEKSKPLPQKPSWRRTIRYYLLRLLRLRGGSKEIARGLAAGVFAGCFPLFGLQTIIGVLLAILIRGNKFAGAAGTWISNPFTYVPIFAFNFQIGKFLLKAQEFSLPQEHLQLDSQSLSEVMDLGFVFVLILFLGSFIVGSIVSITTYFISVRLINRWRASYTFKGKNGIGKRRT